MRKKTWQHLLSMVLVLALLISSMPTQVYGLAGDSLTTLRQQEKDEKVEIHGDSKRSIYEMKNYREANVKHFALPDGSYTAVVYSAPVHMQNAEGNWEDIDNRLVDSAGVFSTSNARVKFAKKITGNEVLFTLHDGNYKIEMSLNGAVKKTEGTVMNQNTEFSSDATELQKQMTLDNLRSQILYADIMDGVDLEYVIESLNVKENIIVREKKDSYQYTFTIALNNLTAMLQEDGSVCIYDPDTEEIIYRIPAGIMYDANGRYSTAVTYALSDHGNGKYSMTIDADADWINAGDRAFPVYIDPSITVNNSSAYEATYTDIENPQFSGTLRGYLQVGSFYSAYWKMTTLPILPAGYHITDAEFTLMGLDPATYDKSTTTLDIGIYNVTTNWSQATLTNFRYSENNEGRYAYYAHDAQNGADVHNQYTFDITKLVQEWYADPTTNYGLAIVSRDPFHSDRFYRFQCSPFTSPLVITYKSIVGLEDYWSYATQNVGVAGTGYVNKATGNLTFAIGALSTTDALFGYTTTVVYNQPYAGRHVISGVANVPNIAPAFGYGMKMSVNEYLVYRTYTDTDGSQKRYIIWTDADGTEHNFYPSDDSATIYQDVDGLQLTLEAYLDENGNKRYAITDKNHIRWVFRENSTDRSVIGEGAMLYTVTDRSGNTLMFTRTDWGRIAEARVVPNESSSITFQRFVYNAHGYVKQIYNYNIDSAPKVKFYYSPNYAKTSDISGDYSGYLKKVEFINENQVVATAAYEYDSSGKLIAAHDEMSGYSVRYTYEDDRVIQITEYAGPNDTQGQTVTLNYSEKCTRIRTAGSDDMHGNEDDIITTYVTDDYGRVISTYSTDAAGTTIYGASCGEYETQDNIKNNIKTSITMGSIGNGYLYNGGFEYSDESGQKFAGWDHTGFSRTVSNDFLRGNFHAGIEMSPTAVGTLSQNVKLSSGKYTLALDVNSMQIPDADFTISVAPMDDPANVLAWQDVPLNEYYASNGFVTVSMQFDTSECESTNYVITIRVAGKSGVSYSTNSCILVDNVVLEKNLGHNGYNLVQFGNFENFCVDDSGVVINRTEAYWSGYAGFTMAQEGILDNCLYFPSDTYTYTKRVWQTVYTNNSSTDVLPKTFMLSAMAKGTQQYASGEFSIEVCVNYTDSSSQTFIFPFRYESTQWQFVSGTITTQGKCIQTIKVTAVYSNPGHAYFDNIYFTPVVDGSLVSNFYDAEGRAIIRKNAYFEEYFQYNENGDVVRIANSQGELYDYTYDANNRPLTETYSQFVVTADGSTVYPFFAQDPGSLITLTQKTVTRYTYNSFGQPTIVAASDAESGQVVKTEYTYNTSHGSRYIGALTSQKDNLGIVTKYYYDTYGKLLATVNTSTETGTCYTYDLIGNVTSVMPAVTTDTGGYSAQNNAESVTYTYNEANLLETIQTESTQYRFHYDVFGNTSSVQVGNNQIAGYTYNAGNGKLQSITYGNGFVIEYAYDELERISQVWYNENGIKGETPAYTYQYDSDGRLHRVTDVAAQRSTIYRYDVNGRLIGYVEVDDRQNQNDFAAAVFYDDQSRVGLVSYTMDYIYNRTYVALYSLVCSMNYDYAGRLQQYQLIAGNVAGQISYTYDGFHRLSSKHYQLGGLSYNVSYAFTTNEGATSAQVSSYTSQVGNAASSVFSYVYDENGNITSVKLNGGQACRYYYDDMGQLIREDNTPLGKTYVYTYDDAGNLLSKKIYTLNSQGGTPTGLISTYNYGYTDANWGDKLTSYRGHTITYDGVGNPLSYYNGKAYSFTWSGGRRLATASVGNSQLSFEYNDEGIRTSKSVGSVKHTYYLNGSQIMAETWGETLLVYLYDAEGNPIGMQHHNSNANQTTFETYWFEKNLQGDIIAVYNSSGVKLISYTYDAWGNVTTSYHNGASNYSVADKNPFRYRGYYYDVETGLYYLQSRYYDPAIGRFLNADAYTSTGQGILGNNMFAYCLNNPVCYRDDCGTACAVAIGYETPILLPTKDPTTGGGISAALTLTTIVVACDIVEKKKVEEKLQVIADAAVSPSSDGRVYFGADRMGGEWKKVTEAMDFYTAQLWVYEKAISWGYGKGASWGLYTADQDDALAMVISLGGAGPCMHERRPGEYPHYHPTGMILFGQYKHFHVWYGSIYEG